VFDIHQKDTYHINLSGKQRMLTQKASLLAFKIGQEGDSITEKRAFKSCGYNVSKP